ncbi:MAG: type II secretion system F family protein [Dehalococcoidia bacterium]
MELIVAIGTFLTVTLTVYGLLYRTTEQGTVASRLGGLHYKRPGRDPLPDPEAAFTVRVVKPVLRSLTGRLNSLLPSTITQRLEGAISSAGIKMSPGQFIVVLAITAGVVPLVLTLAMIGSGNSSPRTVLMIWGTLTGIGVYGPRIWLLGRIKSRRKQIQRQLPDAFDLVTASVEAGLGVDSAFARVIDKVHGPFADELSRTMREIQMGRARRDAFQDMADRTGVEELRSLVNAIIQAETMGISIGGVIRVQTGVMRTKRRQRAEEQAFKAPVKMVFPLVFFIFPAIGVIIGGPAALQIQQGGF